MRKSFYLLLSCLLGSIVLSAQSTSLVINEVDYDQVGGDDAEFIEIKNVSGSVVNLTDVSLDLINGSANTV